MNELALPATDQAALRLARADLEAGSARRPNNPAVRDIRPT